ncbi:bifunctional phosphoribosylaminoimidazolecarboxamide formyltransferase/IMP cyclohydrolase [Candidatus Micrarchaeota archaeon]|nr:bifunctional phosphoribosylaminoimidazolecarboxamide formyltransferase/IMP cyclohydrolase [Candidatus Micrarchaeota archaeon]
MIKTALVSVSNKTGIVEFCRELHKLNVSIISSGGTAGFLSKNKIPVIPVFDYTGFPEMMDGRVKTLHPKIHGGILADRSKKEHLKQAEENGISLIDLVVVNLYPFEQTIQKKGVKEDEVIENIDIGGPALLRSAAKNFKNVSVVSNPEKYGIVLEHLKKSGSVPLDVRKKFAYDAFQHTASYDILVSNYLGDMFGLKGYPEYLNLTFKKIQDLRYGENAHQTASFYRDSQVSRPCVSTSRQLQGKELSYNNILDANSAFELVKWFKEPSVVIVKHNNPCGVATRKDLLDAYETALAVDSKSAFGGVVAVNREITKNLAGVIAKRFFEVVIAPKFSEGALEIFKSKKNLRLLELGNGHPKKEEFRTYRTVTGGLLVQDADTLVLDEDKLKVVSKRKPTSKEMGDMRYAWIICKYTKSNSIVYARDNKAVGIGAGQMKRVDAAKIAAMIAEDYGESVKGCAMASDAFFPFRDGIDAAAEAGVTAVIQPGGSIRDKEVIEAADEHNMAMVFTGIRHFRH